MMTWDELKRSAVIECKKLGQQYLDRIIFEFKEIEKQGLNQVWLDYVSEGKHWDVNPNGLVLPWLLKLTPIDPIAGINMIMIEETNGVKMEAIIIQLDNGEEICVSENTMILTDKGYIKAIDLTTDHTIL